MFSFLLVVLYARGFVAENGPFVLTSLGPIRGFYKSSFHGRKFSAFEGIPYAKPPVGDLRFEPPQNASPWNGVLNANKQYICMQLENAMITDDATIGTEDCLYLNVYVPKTQISTDDNYDVIVNIHGGAFMFGSSTSYAGPCPLMDREIIYVNINYRVGILGFLSTEDNVVPGNNGLKDQQQALKWVQTHIKQFGGNPKSVTLMGASAGGAAVHLHYFSPKSKGLFHRGISQSGTALMSWAIQDGAAQKARKLATILNCEDSNTQTFIKCLKGVPADKLVKQTKLFYQVARLPVSPFAPVVEVESESSFLTKHPYKQLEDSEVNDIPWLTWVTKDEGNLVSIILNKNLNEVETHWAAWAEHLFDYEYVCLETKKHDVSERIKSFYFQNEQMPKRYTSLLLKSFGDRLINVGFETAVQMQVKVTNSSVYAAIYGYNAGVTLSTIFGVGLEGTTHGDDTLLLHGIDAIQSMFPHIQFSKNDVLMKDTLLDLLTSFVINGKPHCRGVEWKPLTSKSYQYLLINNSDNISMSEIPELSPKGFWEALNLRENKLFSEKLPTL
ncbi:venom carboxylesterase-6-like isoform X2 [Photinus pyralis]|nr:venom carboxylesterase-6-like isoform X2 [Photinus pyralis]